MHTSKSWFQIKCGCVLLCVSFPILFYFFQYSITATRFREFHNCCQHHDSLTCIIGPNSFVWDIVILVTSVLNCSLLLNSFIVYLEEAIENKLPIFCWRITGYVDYPVFAGIALLLFKYLLITRFMQGDGFLGVVECPFLVFGLSAFIQFFLTILSYDDVDVCHCVNIKTSIGATYAYGDYNSYYDKIQNNFVSKAREWEQKNKIDLPVKKLVVICPLSCNVRGNLAQRCDKLDKISEFISIIIDQGANMNRDYKHTIYGINNGQNVTHVIAQFASPLGVVWEQKQQELINIEYQKLEFIRDCFIFTLKKRLKDLPCIVVEYDDRNESNSLDRFLLSVVEKELEKNFKVKEV